MVMVKLNKMLHNFPFNTLPETELAVYAVKEAGNAVMKIYKHDFTTTFKKDNEPLTEADLKSNNIIKKIITSTNYPILSEESLDDKKRLDYDKIWIIDPLDGTSDFVSKSGEFTIMIALVDKHEPILGVIYWPTNDILYVAQKGGGAHKLVSGVWEKLAISKRLELCNCRALGSRHHLSSHEVNFLKQLNVEKFSERGSSLKVTDICSGTAELYFTMTNKIKQWDTCASNRLITEAGGKMTDMLGNKLEYNTENIYHKNGILVTNGIIHDIITARYAEFSRKMKNSN
jgi:3'(2'), 5'-bisphosphate nucleotidase